VIKMNTSLKIILSLTTIAVMGASAAEASWRRDDNAWIHRDDADGCTNTTRPPKQLARGKKRTARKLRRQVFHHPSEHEETGSPSYRTSWRNGSELKKAQEDRLSLQTMRLLLEEDEVMVRQQPSSSLQEQRLHAIQTQQHIIEEKYRELCEREERLQAESEARRLEAERNRSRHRGFGYESEEDDSDGDLGFVIWEDTEKQLKDSFKSILEIEFSLKKRKIEVENQPSSSRQVQMLHELKKQQLGAERLREELQEKRRALERLK